MPIEGLAGSIEVTQGPTTDANAPSVPVPVTSGLAAGLSAVGNTISNAFNGISNIKNIKLPMPNPFHSYASYNYIFTLFCLDTAGFNDPDGSYMKGKGNFPIILRSGGGAPNNRIKTELGKFDFFMDDLIIDAKYGFDRATGNSHATKVSFTIYEPYSMGIFQLALQQAAYKQNYSSYATAQYVISIQFMGESQSGSMSVIPSTTKYITFKFDTIDMEVTGAGSQYTCKGTVSSESALLHSAVKLTSEITFSGDTVQKVLQSGSDSFTAIFNKHLKEIAKAGGYYPDEILILFPTDVASKGGSSPPAGGNAPTAAPAESATQQDLLSLVGASRYGDAQILIQNTQVNEIGKSELGYSPSRETPSQSYGAKMYDEKSKQWNQTLVNKDSSTGVYQVSQDSTIINAINQVLLSSNYSAKALQGDPDTLGMRKMWNIIPSVYHVDTKFNDTKTGRKPGLYVYRVVPYGTLALTQPLPGGNIDNTRYTALLKQCAKAYDYIFTGKNTDIKRLDLKFNQNFSAFMANDNFQRGQGVEASTSAIAKSDFDIVYPDGIPTNDPAKGLRSLVNWISTKLSTDGMQAGGPDTEAHRASRLYFDSMMYGKDMAELDMDIVGDPYWLASSGSGNYRANNTQYFNVNSDMSANIHNGEVDIIVRFRTPSDLNQSTGLFNMNGSKSLLQYSGLYKVREVMHHFKDGEFYQKIIAAKQMIYPGDFKNTVPNTTTQVKRPVEDASAKTPPPPPPTI